MGVLLVTLAICMTLGYKQSVLKAQGKEYACQLQELKKQKKQLKKDKEDLKELKKYADDQEQYVISALMDNYISHYTKAVWILKQQSA